eukprot:c19585_g1_i3.p1 GENE.c19585_g1_i3~~c19585_g1_i3.p1  ORF type:complete len:215 (+),score=50.69 c19585_g1_i3:24-647(+)
MNRVVDALQRPEDEEPVQVTIALVKDEYDIVVNKSDLLGQVLQRELKSKFKDQIAKGAQHWFTPSVQKPATVKCQDWVTKDFAGQINFKQRDVVDDSEPVVAAESTELTNSQKRNQRKREKQKEKKAMATAATDQESSATGETVQDQFAVLSKAIVRLEASDAAQRQRIARLEETVTELKESVAGLEQTVTAQSQSIAELQIGSAYQ